MEKLDDGLEVLRGWGHPVIEASNLRYEETYLAGRDEDLSLIHISEPTRPTT